MELKELNLNKVNLLVGYPKYIDEFFDELITQNIDMEFTISNFENNLHYTEYKEKLISILKRDSKKPFIFTTQSKEVLEILVSLLDKKENIVNVISIYKTKSGDLKFFTLNQKAFINNIETNSELRD